MTPVRKAQTSREMRNSGPRRNPTTNGGGIRIVRVEERIAAAAPTWRMR